MPDAVWPPAGAVAAALARYAAWERWPGEVDGPPPEPVVWDAARPVDAAAVARIVALQQRGMHNAEVAAALGYRSVSALRSVIYRARLAGLDIPRSPMVGRAGHRRHTQRGEQP